MKNLDQHNFERQRAWDEKLRRTQHPEEFGNGFACPLDGGILYDTGQVMPGTPSRVRVKCMNHDCTFKGERLE
jgi:hypothetical protein